MRKLIFALWSIPLLALQNGDFSGGNFLSLTGPTVSLTDYRMEFRMDGFSAGGGVVFA